jgi:hypothetical protein
MDENSHDIFEFARRAPAPESTDISETPRPSFFLSRPRRARDPCRSAVIWITLAILGVAILLQVVTALRLMSGTIGFDKPGTSGLDIVGAVVLGIVYVLSWFVGSVISIVRKIWLAVGIQAILVLIMAMYFSPM